MAIGTYNVYMEAKLEVEMNTEYDDQDANNGHHQGIAPHCMVQKALKVDDERPESVDSNCEVQHVVEQDYGGRQQGCTCSVDEYAREVNELYNTHVGNLHIYTNLAKVMLPTRLVIMELDIFKSVHLILNVMYIAFNYDSSNCYIKCKSQNKYYDRGKYCDVMLL